MKIQLAYDRPANISTDLLVIIFDTEVKFHDLTGAPLDEMVRRSVIGPVYAGGSTEDIVLRALTVARRKEPKAMRPRQDQGKRDQ